MRRSFEFSFSRNEYRRHQILVFLKWTYNSECCADAECVIQLSKLTQINDRAYVYGRHRTGLHQAPRYLRTRTHTLRLEFLEDSLYRPRDFSLNTQYSHPNSPNSGSNRVLRPLCLKGVWFHRCKEQLH